MRNKALPWLFGALVLVGIIAVWRTWRQAASLRPLPEIASTSVATKSPGQVTVFAIDPVRGNPSAKYTLVQFSDFECPYCAQAALELRLFLARHPEVKLIWKDFPLPTHPQARPAAEAAQCARAQGKFWEYHDLLYANQGRLSQELYLQLAQQVGLKLSEFTRCTQNHDPAPLINANLLEGQAVGVDGTPYLIVNGRMYNGLITTNELELLFKP